MSWTRAASTSPKTNVYPLSGPELLSSSGSPGKTAAGSSEERKAQRPHTRDKVLLPASKRHNYPMWSREVWEWWWGAAVVLDLSKPSEHSRFLRVSEVPQLRGVPQLEEKYLLKEKGGEGDTRTTCCYYYLLHVLLHVLLLPNCCTIRGGELPSLPHGGSPDILRGDAPGGRRMPLGGEWIIRKPVESLSRSFAGRGAAPPFPPIVPRPVSPGTRAARGSRRGQMGRSCS